MPLPFDEVESSTRDRHWMCTINQGGWDSYELIKESFTTPPMNDRITYFAICKEEETSKHVHVYVRFKNPLSRSALRKCLAAASNNEELSADCRPSICYEPKGFKSFELGRKYIFKEDPDAEEFGDPPEQGKRSDFADIREAVVSGKSMGEICFLATGYQALKAAELMQKYIGPQRAVSRELHKVIWLHGPSGSGKSEWIYENYPSAYRPLYGKDQIWYDGYQGEDTIVFDDFRGNLMKFTDLLRLTDIFPLRVQGKGTSYHLLARTFIFSCPETADRCYSGVGDIYQLTRRITETKEFKRSRDEEGEYPLPANPFYPGNIDPHLDDAFHMAFV